MGEKGDGKGWPEEKGHVAAAAGELGGGSSWSSELARAERDRSGKRAIPIGSGGMPGPGGKATSWCHEGTLANFLGPSFSE